MLVIFWELIFHHLKILSYLNTLSGIFYRDIHNFVTFLLDSILLAFTTSHTGQHRVCNLSGQKVSKKSTETWIGGLRIGKFEFI